MDDVVVILLCSMASYIWRLVSMRTKGSLALPIVIHLEIPTIKSFIKQLNFSKLPCFGWNITFLIQLLLYLTCVSNTFWLTWRRSPVTAGSLALITELHWEKDTSLFLVDCKATLPRLLKENIPSEKSINIYDDGIWLNGCRSTALFYGWHLSNANAHLEALL